MSNLDLWDLRICIACDLDDLDTSVASSMDCFIETEVLSRLVWSVYWMYFIFCNLLYMRDVRMLQHMCQRPANKVTLF